jgi:hypothetical protein
MAEIEDEQKQVELLSKFPWAKTVLILTSAISILFSGLMYLQQNSLKDAKDRETERVSYLRTELTVKDQAIARISAEKDSCNEGKVYMITQMLNREMALKLSKDTGQTVRKIVESLLRASENKDKQLEGNSK